MSTIEQIQQSITERLQQIEAEEAPLREALRALDSNGQASPTQQASPAQTSTGTTPTTRRRRRRPAKAATEVVPAGRLAAVLAGSDGLTTAELAEQTNGDRSQILTLLKDLEAQGKVRRTGQRRGMRWHLVTDDDKIAERAAELEKGPKR